MKKYLIKFAKALALVVTVLIIYLVVSVIGHLLTVFVNPLASVVFYLVACAAGMVVIDIIFDDD